MSTPTSYQRVGNVSSDPTDYDWQSQPLYLRYDGSDDYMLTNSVNFTGTDKMTVWAGVRKLSDAATGVFVEFSADSFSNNGVFLFSAPAQAAPDYFLRFRGTQNASAATAASYPSPLTSVMAGIGDIAGDVCRLRYNGTQILNITTDQGTGNFGNYPLYIGRRGGTTNPFNGRIYSLIIRGAQSTTQQIEQTETYVNTKTRAF
jgi:hypothetical protein